MSDNPLFKLQQLGQRVWMDYIHRQMINSGELQCLIEDDGLKGITSNPAIFEKAIAGSRDYDYAIRALALASNFLVGGGLNHANKQRTAEDFGGKGAVLSGARPYFSYCPSPSASPGKAS